MSDDTFYDPKLVALVPMGFCYPGTGKGGDHPPRMQCAHEWHDRVLGGLESISLSIIIGRYAFIRYLGAEYESLTDATRAFRDMLPGRIALPHPSPRNNIWLKKHPWFEREAIVALRARVRALLSPRD